MGRYGKINLDECVHCGADLRLNRSTDEYYCENCSFLYSTKEEKVSSGWILDIHIMSYPKHVKGKEGTHSLTFWRKNDSYVLFYNELFSQGSQKSLEPEEPPKVVKELIREGTGKDVEVNYSLTHNKKNSDET